MPLPTGNNLAHAVETELSEWDARGATARLWARDASLWTASGEDRWLGWLDAPEHGARSASALADRLRAAVPRDVNDILLIGMGGSSLAPEVIARVLPAPAGARTIRILDSTHPAAVRDAFDATNWRRTMIVVASKSGSTLEPDILLSAALASARASIGDAAPKHVVAITDPGSRLGAQAAEQGFADVVLGDPTIGGRFSALSPFGLVHVALRGVDVLAFLTSAQHMSVACRAPAIENPGVQLGAFLATCARAGRNKCTLVLAPAFAALGAWIEQLVAESTGKNGVAILPIDGEALSAPGTYGTDRAFVHVRNASAARDDATEAMLSALEAAGHPVFVLDVEAAHALAGEFFRWEFATAVAGAMLGVNPFDQPDVEASKVATRALTDAYERGERPAEDAPSAGADIARVLATCAPGDYFGLLAFLPQRPDVEAQLQHTRARVRDVKRVATTIGFGPRYLHSTGQAFKGGPANGIFVQLTWDGAADVPVPGRRVTFGQVVSAQAAGDRAVLRARGQRVLHINLHGDLSAALKAFDHQIAEALT